VATLPGPTASGEGTANLDSVVTEGGHRYTDVPTQPVPSVSGQYQQGPGIYGCPANYGQSTNNVTQPMWDQGPAMPRMAARQQTPRGTMSSAGMPPMVKYPCTEQPSHG
jgi:hypothetical protein